MEKEAQKRGLLELKTTADALPHYTDPKNLQLFENTMYIQLVNCMLVKVSYSQTTTKWFKLKLRQWLIC